MAENNEPQVNNRPISHVIRQRRAQILVHSYLYYILDSPLVSDDKWQEWANELVKLQHFWRKSIPWHVQPGFEINGRKYQKTEPFFDKAFEGFNGATGHHLPLDHPWVVRVGQRLLKLENVDKDLPI